ncbi:MAG: tetratricopeptide repeat protein [Chloroflexi bacterium]|nr:tetratricopeptide repeat protein [Chloroflexota bacterium]
MIHIWRAEYAEARALAEPVSVNTLLNEAAVGRARHLMALVEMAIGNLDTAIDHLEAILPFFERSNASYYVSAVLQDLAIAYARSGSMASASHFLQRLVSIRRTLGQTNALALALNNLGYHYHEMGDYELALSTLEEGLRIVSQSQNQRAESYIRWSIGDLQRDLGNTDAALRLYEGAYEASAGTEPVLQQSVALSMAALYRWREDMRLAQWLVRDVNDTIRKLDASDASINRLARVIG